MAEEARDLLLDFEARFARGEHPDPRPYLERAGDGADELRDLLDRFLRTAPAPPADPALVAMFDAWAKGEPPLLELRCSRGVKQTQVVAALMRDLAIAEPRRSKVARYYQRLETGLLDAARVDGRVFTALAKALGAKLSDFVLARSPSPAVADAYLRSSAEAEELLEVRVASLDEMAERDEVDDLFDGEPG